MAAQAIGATPAQWVFWCQSNLLLEIIAWLHIRFIEMTVTPLTGARRLCR